LLSDLRRRRKGAAMTMEQYKKLRELIKKLDLIEEHQSLNEKRIKDVRMEIVHMLPLVSRQ
jgi:hypothetical protein